MNQPPANEPNAENMYSTELKSVLHRVSLKIRHWTELVELLCHLMYEIRADMGLG